MDGYHPKSIVLALLAFLMLISCSDSSSKPTSGGGVGGTGVISRGHITSIGSIVVNGTEFNTDDTVIIVGGEEKGIGDDVVMDNLKIGMVVTVKGRLEEDGRWKFCC